MSASMRESMKGEQHLSDEEKSVVAQKAMKDHINRNIKHDSAHVNDHPYVVEVLFRRDA